MPVTSVPFVKSSRRVTSGGTRHLVRGLEPEHARLSSWQVGLVAEAPTAEGPWRSCSRHQGYGLGRTGCWSCRRGAVQISAGGRPGALNWPKGCSRAHRHRGTVPGSSRRAPRRSYPPAGAEQSMGVASVLRSDKPGKCAGAPGAGRLEDLRAVRSRAPRTSAVWRTRVWYSGWSSYELAGGRT